MSLLINFSPILLFVSLYVGAGVYLTTQGVANAFYQVSPCVAILPAIILGWILQKGTNAERSERFLDGLRHQDIMTMCIIFLLAGAFSTVTKSIGSIDSVVNLTISILPSEYLLIGLFLMSAFISTAIGTSMGTIAAVGPIAAKMAASGAISPALGMATIVGGAMFGDNLSLISDTTIAAVFSQKANLKAKVKLNVHVAIVTAILTVALLFFIRGEETQLVTGSYHYILILPYILLVALATAGLNTFVVLTLSLFCAAVIGIFCGNYSLLTFGSDIYQGFQSMFEILLLSMLVGGLSGLSGDGPKNLINALIKKLPQSNNPIIGQLLIAKIVSVFDILLANNTIAIIFSGEMAKDISKKYNIPAHYSALWLDIFSCVFQGLIPYGAQVLLASGLAGLSPLEIIPHVHYCYLLAAVSILFILIRPINYTHHSLEK